MADAHPGWSARQGLLTAASVVLAVFAGAYLGLPDLWWAAISAWVVANPDFNALLRKLAMRLAGTVAGVLFGYNLALSIEGLAAFQILALFASSAIGTYQRFSSRYGYAWFYGSFTVTMTVAVSMLQPSTLFSFAQFRLLEITLGVCSSAIVHTVAGPASQSSAAAPTPTPNGPQLDLMRLAFVAGFSAIGVTILWSWLDVPSLPQALASTLTVIDRDLAMIRTRARQRFLGCVLGGALGVAAVWIDLQGAAIYFAVLFAGIFYFSRVHHGGGRQSYIGTQGGIAFITAMVTGDGPPSALEPILGRLAGIFAGVTLMLLVSFVLGAMRRRAGGADAGLEAEPQERLATT